MPSPTAQLDPFFARTPEGEPQDPALPVPTFPVLLDSTMLSAFKSCARKGFFEYHINRVNANANPHFVAGGAYAFAHEVFRKLYYGKGLPFQEALELGAKALIKSYGMYEAPEGARPSEAAKSWDRVLCAYLCYYSDYPPTSDFIVPAFELDEMGTLQPMTEFSFAVPLEINHPETGEPLLYGGRSDSIVHLDQRGWSGDYNNHRDKPVFVYDDKTTYQLGPQWAEQWKLRSQFTGYTWAARQLGYSAKGVIVRGCGLQKNDIKFVPCVSYRPDWMIDEWLETTYDTIQDMIRWWDTRRWKKDLDSACTSYGGCQFRTICHSAQPHRWVNTGFIERTWSPIDIESL